MGLISSMSNAVSGLKVNQDSIDVLSRNVANAGTPGYHRQSVNIVDFNSQNGTYANTMGVERAFNSSLQTYYNRQVASTASASVKSSYLNQLQTYLGKPGDATSLDTMFGGLKNALQALSTSPDDYSARATVVSQAQAMAERLNQLTTLTQGLRQETESRMSNDVNSLNGMLSSLKEVNARMLDLGIDDASRASLLDQRDRLVSGVAELIDVKATYRTDGTVSLMTNSGVGVLDNNASVFSFTSAGALSPTSLSSNSASQSKVGSLTMTTPSGLVVDLTKTGILQGGELAGLVELRDKTLVEFQSQLDEIAAALASAFSTVQTQGTAATSGGATGFSVDVSGVQPGNDVLLNYTTSAGDQRVRIVNSTSGEDYVDSTGQRYIAIDFSDPAAESVLAGKLPGLDVSLSGGTLQILNDGTPGTTKVNSLVSRTSATSAQSGTDGMLLFVDQGNAAFTNNPDSNPPQKLGFAGRITINPAVLADNKLLVQSDATTTLGDASRPNYLLSQLNSMTFLSGGSPAANDGKFQLNGTLGDMIGQVLNYQGTSIASAMTQSSDRQLTLDTIVTQMESDYGVDVDQEMARLMQLQNAYAANARVVSVVKELLDALFASV